jgi:predicted nucleotidyltransferase
MDQQRVPVTPRPPVDESLIREITQRIVAELHPRRIILFGSRARGDQRPDSDVDLFVEMETTGHPVEKRWAVGKLFPKRRWGLDVVVYTPEEVGEWSDSLASILPDILKEGKVLYEQP